MTDEATYAYVHKKVLRFFGGNTEKTGIWFNSPNYGLGNITPNDMVRLGLTYKLKAFVDSLLEEPT